MATVLNEGEVAMLWSLDGSGMVRIIGRLKTSLVMNRRSGQD